MHSPRNHDIWWAVLAFVLLVLLMASLDGCAKPRPALLVDTRGGEPMIQREVEKTGSRKDVPMNKKPREVKAQAKFSHRGGVGMISITQGFWPWSDVQVSTNCARCHAQDPIPFTRPKDPWWKWPVLILGAVGIAAMLYFLEKIKRILFFWKLRT